MWASFRRIGLYNSVITLMGLTWLLLGSAESGNASQATQADSDPVIAAAGDIACDPNKSNFNGGAGTSVSCRQQYTSDLLVDAGLAAVLPLGDVQYECGSYEAFMASYDRSWGRLKSISRPIVGNHEYLTSGASDCTEANAGAAGYFQYFGFTAGPSSRGYYSYNIGEWHLIALNSECKDIGGCDPDSPQGKWLAADLAANPRLCTLAYWHIPLFSSGGRANSNAKPLWQMLYDHDVDILLTGHDHIYERFAPQTADGVLDTTRGIRQFVVGTGGANHTPISEIAANSEVRDDTTYGVLMLTLRPDSYDWQFVPEPGGAFTDSGTASCHGSIPSITKRPVKRNVR